MNDFTKEELQEIIDHMYEAETQHSVYPEKVLEENPLYVKIQSMIDNYCEHQMGYDAGEHSSCRKCGHRE